VNFQRGIRLKPAGIETDEGNEMAEDDGFATMPVEPALGPVAVPVREPEKSTIALDKGADALFPELGADAVDDQRAPGGADGGGDDHERQREATLTGKKTGQRQDQLGGEGREEVFQSHERRDPDVAETGNDVGYPLRDPADEPHSFTIDPNLWMVERAGTTPHCFVKSWMEY
jgi:hypothetical protein